jgi:hypothetical protein
MIHTLIVDSPSYFCAAGNGHVLAKMWFKIFSVFGSAQLEVAAAVQIVLIMWSAARFNWTVGIRDRGLRYLSCAVLMAPCLYWGRQIGSDAIGYILFLSALTHLKTSHLKFIAFASLATLTRFQYIGLFGALFLSRRAWWVPAALVCALAWVVATGWNGMLGMYGKVYKTVEYLECTRLMRTEHISESEFFNLAWGDHTDPFPRPEEGCLKQALSWRTPARILWDHRADYATLLKSKVRESFRFHQIAFFLLMLIAPMTGITHIAFTCLCMYAMILITSSMRYTQYTFMVEMVMIACVIKLYDILKRRK